MNTKQFFYVEVNGKKKDSVTNTRSQHISYQSHVTPPHSHCIIYNGTGSLMFTPPPDTPFSHIVTNVELMHFFSHPLRDSFFVKLSILYGKGPVVNVTGTDIPCGMGVLK